MARRSYDIVEYFGEQDGHKCGYCKSSDTNINRGMWAHILSADNYQILIDRGWRRSGYYCYKPIMDRTCCPMYTIKCEALQFKISKSQKKVLKRMAKFLKNKLNKNDNMDVGEEYRNDIDIRDIPNYSKHLQRAEEAASEMDVKLVNDEINRKSQPAPVKEEKKDSGPEPQQKRSDGVPCALSDNHDVASRSMQSLEADPSRIPCKKAKLLRIERKQNKLLAQGKTREEVEAIFRTNKQQNEAKSLEDLFDEIQNGTSRLKLKLVRTSPMSSEYLKTSKASYKVYKKYQTTIHRDPEEKVTEEQFTRFLVKSSLQPLSPGNGPPDGYGSFHDQYWLDDKLIAVGVIDILPYCVSSVYFYYDPAYSHLSLGIFSCLREVYLTRQLNKVADSLKYYYMGFYIHTCPKMQYKARMKPSKLLCPETYEWFDIEDCLIKLDKQKYCRFNQDIDAIDLDGVVDIDDVLILHKDDIMPYGLYKERSRRSITKEQENAIKEYATLVGMKCAQSLLLYRS
ncbi:arginyltransferase 1 isoform X1 [Andrena cerasifolii]|uniref:arginyltransferase 1 isoform X1 n=1 Tax=Andrena cerasifolii TaxID=2819439 RepID=UPI004037D7F5